MKNNFLHQFSRRTVQNLVLLTILILFLIVFTIINPRFFSQRNITNIIRQSVAVLIMGCAMTFVINSGAIDLSVGGVMAFAAISFGKFITFGINVWVAFIMTLVLGVFVGAVNTFLIHKFKLPPIMATMAVWVVTSGLSYAFISAMPITDIRLTPIFQLNTMTFFNKTIPLALFIILGVIAFFLFLEKKTIIGKYSLAIGGNENAAIFSGINVTRIRLIIYILSGVMAAFAGVYQVARIGSADPNIGIGMEFQVIAGCILGGVSIKGGDGSIAGMLIGTFLLIFLTNGMNMIGFNPYYQQVATGIVILVSVLINYLVSTQRKRVTFKKVVKPCP
jgi:ribose transport system permease protein